MSFTMFLLITGLIIQDSQLGNIELEIEPDALAVGQTAVLTWNVKGADKIFVSFIGNVGPSGRREITPEETTRYTLIAENRNGVFTKTVTVEVGGSRGADEFPDETKFKHPIVSRLSSRSFPEVLQHIQSILQDTLQFNLFQYMNSSDQYVFLTNQSRQPGLVEKGETRIAARRLAYLVEVTRERSKSGEYAYTIKALLEYRRKVERTWRNEGDESMYQKQVRKLQAVINRKP